MFGSGLYNPYLASSYYQGANLFNLGRMGSGALATASKAGIGSGLGKGILGKFSFSGFLNGASKTLNVVNQAIPIFYQVKPMINNAKTMFRVIGAVNSDSSKNDSTVKTNNINNNTEIIEKVEVSNSNVNNYNSDENPTFFI